MRNLKIAFIALAAALLLSGAVQASINTIILQSAEFDTGNDGDSFTAYVPQFHPEWGNLTSVTLLLNVAVDPSVVVINDKTTGTITAKGETYINANTMNPLSWTDEYGNSATPALPYAYTSPILTVAAGHEVDYLFPTWIVQPTKTISVLPADFGEFVGYGLDPFSYDVGGNADAALPYLTGGLAHVTAGSDYDIAGTMTVIYHTSEVPAPAALLLGLVGLSGLGLLKRRFA